MPRDGAIIFRDLVGKLDVLEVECDTRGRRRDTGLDRGIDAKGLARLRPPLGEIKLYSAASTAFTFYAMSALYPPRPSHA